MEEIVQLIQNVGFPVVMCLMLWKYISSTEKKQGENMAAMDKTLKQNTEVIQKLVTILEGAKYGEHR